MWKLNRLRMSPEPPADDEDGLELYISSIKPPEKVQTPKLQ